MDSGQTQQEGQTQQMPTQPALSISDAVDRPRLVSVVFDADSVDVEDITPYADAPSDVQLEILAVRRMVGSLLSAREEMDAMADIHEADAEEAESKVESDERLTPIQRKHTAAQARRSHIMADRCRVQKRQNELEIMAHLARKQG